MCTRSAGGTHFRPFAVVLNRDGELHAAVEQLAAIITAEKLRVSRLGLAPTST